MSEKGKQEKENNKFASVKETHFVVLYAKITIKLNCH
jgi:hypothetical protein